MKPPIKQHSYLDVEAMMSWEPWFVLITKSRNLEDNTRRFLKIVRLLARQSDLLYHLRGNISSLRFTSNQREMN